jgi:hypothetical protein
VAVYFLATLALIRNVRVIMVAQDRIREESFMGRHGIRFFVVFNILGRCFVQWDASYAALT